MTRRPVRLTLLLAFLAALGTTAYLFWVADRQARTETASTRAFDDAVVEALSQVTELRAAQQAYVATGQSTDFWLNRTGTLLNELRSKVAALRASTASAAGASALDEAAGVLQDFEQMDVRARDYTRGRQIQLASDLIFADGHDLTLRTAAAIEQARTAERASRDASVAALHRRQLFSIGAGAVAAILVMLLLLPGAAEYENVSPRVSSPIRYSAPIPVATTLAVDPSLDEGWSPPIRKSSAVEALPEPLAAPVGEPAVEPLVPAVAAAGPRSAQEPAPPAVDLPGVASLCGDLAKVTDTQDLPGLLERAANLLDASGIVLWIADPDGRELSPILAHGYPANVLSRLGTIAREAENVTASAFRTGLLQTLKADAQSNGAIAAPIVAPSGCVGVMAAELRHEGEQQEPKLATASIVAAQLATLVGPPAARNAKNHAAGA